LIRRRETIPLRISLIAAAPATYFPPRTLSETSMRPNSAILAVAFAAVFGARCLSGAALPLFDYQGNQDRKGDYETRKDIAYGVGAIRSGKDTLTLRLDAFLPEGMDGFSKAALLFVHGGGFQTGNKREYRDECRYFARKGFAAFTISYRLRRDEPPLPAGEAVTVASYARPAFVDTKTALRWIHTHAAEFGIDPERIFISGTSAGAIAALAAGVTSNQAFVSDVPDRPAPAANSPGASTAVRGIIDFCGGLYGMVDSIDAQDPAILIYHGTRDPKVPYAEALAVRDRCSSVGLPCEFYPIEGRGHCPSQPAENGKTLRQLTYEFILKRLNPGQGGTVLQKGM
jgi:para-nitrobenzyl esterase